MRISDLRLRWVLVGILSLGGVVIVVRCMLIGRVNSTADVVEADDSRATHLPISDECRSAFEWFDSLGYEDVAELRFVHIEINSDTAYKPVFYGFAVEDNDQGLFLLGATLDRWRFSRVSARVSRYTGTFSSVIENNWRVVDHDWRVVNNNADFLAFSERYLATARILFALSPNRERAALFYYAWACWRRCHDEMAMRIFSRLSTTSTNSLQRELESDFAYLEMGQAVARFPDRSATRQDLIGVFQRFISRFPDSVHTTRARETATMLEAMITEDEAHARSSSKTLEEMGKSERISELVFRLRDQSGKIWVGNNRADILPGTAADDLRAIGIDAVPKLIEALDDSRYSRALDHRNELFGPGHGFPDLNLHLPKNVTVGMWAHMILFEIAKHLPELDLPYGEDRNVEQIKKRATAWYCSLQDK